jgi:tRNA(fMet)-specific endonuclease VapC
MKTYLFDTNILLYFFRQDKKWEAINSTFDLSIISDNVVSVVVWGEILSLGTRNGWGKRRLSELDRLNELFLISDIYDEKIIHRYAEIDAFSEGKLPLNPLGTTARNMGKNDLWIAATASVLGLTLLTTDKDFNHLNGIYLDVDFVDLEKILK